MAVIKSKDKKFRYQLNEQQMSIGSASGVDIQIQYPSVAPVHALITNNEKGMFQLIDQGSYFGTSVNNQRLAPGVPMTIREGDRLGFGDLFLIFSARETAEDAAAFAAPEEEETAPISVLVPEGFPEPPPEVPEAQAGPPESAPVQKPAKEEEFFKLDLGGETFSFEPPQHKNTAIHEIGTFAGSDVQEVADFSGETYIGPQKLFRDLLQQYTRPISEFISHINNNKSLEGLLEGFQGSVKILLDSTSTTAMDFPDLHQKIGQLRDILMEVEKSKNYQDPEVLEEVNTIYRLLSGIYEDLFPPFTVSGPQRSQGEAIAIAQLLNQIPGLGPKKIRKIYQAGLSSLSAFRLATAQDIRNLCGLSLKMAQRVVRQFQEMMGFAAGDPKDIKARIRRLVRELNVYQLNYEEVAGGGELSEEAYNELKLYDRRRRDAGSQISMLLALLEEFSRIEDMSRAPFRYRLKLIDDFLAADAPTHEGPQEP